jgi:8-oxo-dGTP diphosphatase
LKKFDQFKNPALAVDLIVFGYHETNLFVLLLNRKDSPYKDWWTLPGAFLQEKETFQETCTRVLKTKLGMTNFYLEQLYTFDNVKRDPRGRVISVAYYSLINPKNFEITAGKMANDVKWFVSTDLPKLGFDHSIILDKAIQRLKSKILYLPVGFELLDDTFTMPELHTLYESILNVKIDRRNFRRKILDSEYIISTGTKREGLQNRHPDLYKFNEKLKPNNFQININLS